MKVGSQSKFSPNTRIQIQKAFPKYEKYAIIFRIRVQFFHEVSISSFLSVVSGPGSYLLDGEGSVFFSDWIRIQLTLGQVFFYQGSDPDPVNFNPDPQVSPREQYEIFHKITELKTRDAVGYLYIGRQNC